MLHIFFKKFNDLRKQMKTIWKNNATTLMAGHMHTTVPVCYAHAAKLVKGFKPLQESPSPSAESKVPAHSNPSSYTSSCLPRHSSSQPMLMCGL